MHIKCGSAAAFVSLFFFIFAIVLAPLTSADAGKKLYIVGYIENSYLDYPYDIDVQDNYAYAIAAPQLRVF